MDINKIKAMRPLFSLEEAIRHLRAANPNTALKAADEWADFLEEINKEDSLFKQSLEYNINIFCRTKDLDNYDRKTCK